MTRTWTWRWPMPRGAPTCIRARSAWRPDGCSCTAEVALGPLIDAHQRDHALNVVERSAAAGARPALLCWMAASQARPTRGRPGRRRSGGHRRGAEFALESTGRPEVLAQAIEALGPLGHLRVVGAPPLGTKAEFDVNNLLLGGRSIRGIVEGDSVPRTFIPKLIELHRHGRFPFDKLVKFYSLDQINEAAEDSHRGGTLKAVLRMPH